MWDLVRLRRRVINFVYYVCLLVWAGAEKQALALVVHVPNYNGVKDFRMHVISILYILLQH
jgi:hypothetical protein